MRQMAASEWAVSTLETRTTMANWRECSNAVAAGTHTHNWRTIFPSFISSSPSFSTPCLQCRRLPQANNG